MVFHDGMSVCGYGHKSSGLPPTIAGRVRVCVVMTDAEDPSEPRERGKEEDN